MLKPEHIQGTQMLHDLYLIHFEMIEGVPDYVPDYVRIAGNIVLFCLALGNEVYIIKAIMP
jgi:hypothetical protein